MWRTRRVYFSVSFPHELPDPNITVPWQLYVWKSNAWFAFAKQLKEMVICRAFGWCVFCESQNSREKLILGSQKWYLKKNLSSTSFLLNYCLLKLVCSWLWFGIENGTISHCCGSFFFTEVVFSFVIGMKLEKILLKSNFDFALFAVWKGKTMQIIDCCSFICKLDVLCCFSVIFNGCNYGTFSICKWVCLIKKKLILFVREYSNFSREIIELSFKAGIHFWLNYG